MTRCITAFGKDKTTANELYRTRVRAGILLHEATEWYAMESDGIIVCATCGRITAAQPRCVHCGKATKP